MLIDGQVVPVANIAFEVGAVVANELDGEGVDDLADIAATELHAHGAGGFGDDAPDAIIHGGGEENLFAAGGGAGDGDLGAIDVFVGDEIIHGAGVLPAGAGVSAGEVAGLFLALGRGDAGEHAGVAGDGAGGPAVADGVIDRPVEEKGHGMADVGDGQRNGDGGGDRATATPSSAAAAARCAGDGCGGWGCRRDGTIGVGDTGDWCGRRSPCRGSARCAGGCRPARRDVRRHQSRRHRLGHSDQHGRRGPGWCLRSARQ